MSHTGWMELNIEKVKEANINPDKQKVTQAFWTDIQMQTLLHGLFVGEGV